MEHRLDIALLAGLDLDAFEEFANPIVGAKVGVDERARLFRGHAGVAREAEVAQAVEQAEIDDLGEAPLIGRNLLLWDAKDFSRRPRMNVFAAGKGVEQHRVVGHMRQHAELDLRVICREQDVTGPARHERTPHLLTNFGSDGNVL